MHPRDLSIHDFDYVLPEDRIALFPLEERDQSRLLIYRDGSITEDRYRHLAAHLPVNTFLVFNDTRVINARVLFTKPTGGIIEIFLLEPYGVEYTTAMQARQAVQWKCMIGGAGKWKQRSLERTVIVAGVPVILRATLTTRLSDAYVVELDWTPGDIAFAELLACAGETPLPPYIKRAAAPADAMRYQTIYSRSEGSVAAPTAGLHFTRAIFEDLERRQITSGFVTLHVGAGTFKPVKSETMQGHEMHAEWIDVSTDFISQLVQQSDRTVICVGTTSARTVESLYWMGVKTLLDPGVAMEDLEIGQWEAYGSLAEKNIPPAASLRSLLRYAGDRGLKRFFLRTQLLITPGYTFRIARALITNFHQPRSTLLLLVAAMTGDDWRKIYGYALDHDFRFLSYGDGCLIFDKGRPGI